MENYMSNRIIAVGVAALVAALPLQAQRRGTVELGAFGAATSYDNNLLINNGSGAGLRVGAFLDPRWAIEFDGSGMGASRSNGFSDVHVNSLSARLALTPIVTGPLSWVISAGAVQTDYGTKSSYGMTGLLGAKYALGDRVALRADVITDYMPKGKDINTGFRAGISFFRQPFTRVQTVTVDRPMARAVLHEDSVSATEQKRLRLAAANYDALRDSLRRTPLLKPNGASSLTALATMREMIQFATDSSILSTSAKNTLDSKLAIFRDNPAMRIVIVGNTDERATDAYNLALGGRRAEAAKAYLVSKGVDPVRIEIASHGESQPIAGGTSTDAQAQNRRAEFRLLVASDYLLPPKK
jgi:outer membrane protein OmpA-like peptidoglycan-associated protein